MSVGSVIVRTRMASDSTFVDLRFSHPMETGDRKDSMGVLIPPWYLTQVHVFHNDEQVAALELGPLVSRNPAVSLVLNAGVENDRIKITWVDSRGETGEQLAKIA